MTSLLERQDFDALLEALRRRGDAIIGPTVRDGAIVCGQIDSTDNLPAGWVDEPVAPGRGSGA